MTERLHHVDQLGIHISSLCGDKDTFKLQRRDLILGRLSQRHGRPPNPNPVLTPLLPLLLLRDAEARSSQLPQDSPL